jgi:MFS transporter, putative metabolite:H+ symporter
MADALARLDRLPRWPWPRSILVNLGGSFFFAFFDIVAIGAALPTITADFGITAAQGGFAVTAGLLGLVLGSFAGAALAAKKSRVFALQTALWVFSLGMLLSVFAPNLTWLIVARFIAGFGTGADIAVVVTYVAEVSPLKSRGRITGFTAICGYAGIAVVPFLALVLTTNFTWGWRALFAFGALGGLLVVLTRRHMPPSPRLLAQRGETDRLEALVADGEARVRAHVGELPPVPVTATGVAPPGPGRPAVTLIVVFTIAWFVYYFGNYGWLTVAPTILTQNGFALASSLGFLSIANLGLVVGAVASYGASDRFERKWLLVITFSVWGAALGLIGVVGSGASIAVLGFAAAFTIGLGVPIFYAFTAEHFSSPNRPWGMAWTDGVGHLGGAVAPHVLIGLSLTAAFGAMAVSGFLVALILLATTRTMGRSLEQLAP